MGEIVSITGRYYAMDRDRRWERIEKAYLSLVKGVGNTAQSAQEAFEDSYKKGVTDEFIEPVHIVSNGKKVLIENGDSVIYFNFRTDRARQLTRAFVQKDFDGFNRKTFLPNLYFVSFVEFENSLEVAGVAFPPQIIDNTLGKVLSELGVKQARVAETEKYAFVTYYFSGMNEARFSGEQHFLIPSPKVATYDLQPEMATPEIAGKISNLLKSGKHSFIFVNFANPDMVGHTGVLKAGISAVESVDKALKLVIGEVLSRDGVCVITSDHGNVEQMINPKTGEIDTKHNTHPVPFIIIGKEFEKESFKGKIKKGGSLADIAPTVLRIMGIKKPKAMTGTSLT
jgi:2,3-bisphosphoglycerate-independent phosphoglycerate mutase